jgi:hypothetical protein
MATMNSGRWPGGLGRPQGEVRLALRQAAVQGPGTVRELAGRSQVGLRVAQVTVSRMVDNGELLVLQLGRPAVVGLPDKAAAPPRQPTPKPLWDCFEAINRAMYPGLCQGDCADGT